MVCLLVLKMNFIRAVVDLGNTEGVFSSASTGSLSKVQFSTAWIKVYTPAHNLLDSGQAHHICCIVLSCKPKFGRPMGILVDKLGYRDQGKVPPE